MIYGQHEGPREKSVNLGCPDRESINLIEFGARMTPSSNAKLEVIYLC